MTWMATQTASRRGVHPTNPSLSLIFDHLALRQGCLEHRKPIVSKQIAVGTTAQSVRTTAAADESYSQHRGQGKLDERAPSSRLFWNTILE